VFKKALLNYLLSALLLLICNNAYSSHPLGGEIRITQLNKDSIKVNLKFYRDCNGVQLCNSCGTLNTPLNCSIGITIYRGIEPQGISHNLPQQNFKDSTYGFVNLLIKPGKNPYDVVQLCHLSKSICNNCNTRTPGTFTPGIEIYEFEGSTSIAYIPDSVCWLTLGSGTCCTQNYITNITNPGSQLVYIHTSFNRCAAKGNSTVQLHNNPVFVICSGVDHSFNLAASDPDSDSLSYRLGAANSSNGVSFIYLPPFTSQAPFAYLGFPLSSPPLQPPLGININPITGEIKFRPMGTFSAKVVFEVLEWRTVNGVPTLMAITARDFVLFSQVCSINENPILIIRDDKGQIPDSQLNLNICATDSFINKCLYITANDANRSWDTTDIAFTYTGDTNLLKITYPYNRATRHINGPKYDSLRLCLQGRITSANTLLNIVARDRACPITGRTSKTLKIIVGPAPQTGRLKSLSIGHLKRSIWIDFASTPALNNDSTIIAYEYPYGSENYTNIAVGLDSIPLLQYPDLIGGFLKFKIRYLAECGMIYFTDSVFFNPVGLKLKSSKNPNCFNDSNGIIVVDRFGFGSVWVKHKLGVYKTNDTLANLKAGNYWIFATDSLNNVDSIFATLINPTPLVAAYLNLSSAACPSDTNASVTLSQSGGTPPYTYSDNLVLFVPNPTFINPSSAPKTYTVMDSKGCASAIWVPFNQTQSFNLMLGQVTHIACKGGNSGQISITPIGGVSPFTYSLNGGNAQNNASFSNLGPGNKTIVATDNRGCKASLQTTLFEPNQSLSLSGNIQPIICYNGNGSILLSATGGSKPYRYGIYNNAQSESTNPLIKNLSAGQQILYVKDSHNCVVQSSFILVNPSPFMGTANVEPNPCFEDKKGEIIAHFIGGKTPYLYRLDSGAYQTDSSFSNLASGNYWISVKDANNCLAGIPINLAGNPPLEININKVDETCLGAKNGSAKATISGGKLPYDYAWLFNPPLANLEALNLTSDKYLFRVQDAAGCQKTDSVFIGSKLPYEDEKICAVSKNIANGYNQITWNKTPFKNTAAHLLFAQVGINGTPTLIASVPFDAPALFTDSVSPKSAYILYGISTKDSCGNTSPLSALNAAPFLSTSLIGNKIQLTWTYNNTPTGYEGMRIFKLDRNGLFKEISYVLIGKNTFTDSIDITPSNSYYLEAIYQPLCNATFKVFSNISKPSLSSNNYAAPIQLYPNPALHWIKLFSGSSQTFNQVSIFNLQGQLLYTFQSEQSQLELEINIQGFARGVYQVVVRDAAGFNQSLQLVVN